MKNILLIRLRLIGDVVFTTPIPRALKQVFPGARLTYVVEPAAAPIVRGNPYLDEVIVASRPGGLSRVAADVALALRLRRARYDLVIDLHGGPRSSWLTWASGAPQRIGYQSQGARLDVHAHRGAPPRVTAAALGAEPVGLARGD